MKQQMNLSEFFSFLGDEGIVLTDSQIQSILLFNQELVRWSSKMNLISAGDARYIVDRHFLTSFYYYKYLNIAGITEKQTILDIGTGAGLPGLLLSIMLKNRIVLLDSSRKKTIFLKNVLKKIEVNSEVVCKRAEDPDFVIQNKFNIVTARAVAPITKLVELVWPVMETGGYLLTLKGQNYKTEIEKKVLEKIKITEFQPIVSWLNYSAYLNNKIMLKVEKKNA